MGNAIASLLVNRVVVSALICLCIVAIHVLQFIVYVCTYVYVHSTARETRPHLRAQC